MTVAVDGNGNGSRPAPDLMSRYQDYVERTVSSSRATREIYAELLGRVASGDVDPLALDRGLHHFVQLNGPGYAAGIAELSLRFLAGVVQVGNRSAYDLLDAVAPGAAGTPAADAPPASDPDDPGDWSAWFDRLTDEAERGRAAQTRALRAVLDRVASGELDPETAERIADEQSRRQSPLAVTRLAELYVELLTGLEELNAGFGTDYLRSVVRRLERPDSIELRGRPGESVQVRLVVANDEPDHATMRCMISEVRREDGIGPAFTPIVDITPDRLDLATGAEALVSCALTLTDAFAPDATYVGEFRVLAGSETALTIPVRIRATESAESGEA